MTDSHPPADREAAFEAWWSAESAKRDIGSYHDCERAFLAGYDASAARVAELEAEVSTLRGAVSWIEEPFVSAATPKSQLWQRIRFVQADIARIDARAARASTPSEGEK